MSKLKKIVLFAGLGAIFFAVILITAISLIQYQIYRSKANSEQAQVVEYTDYID